jgi:predicted NBD/HSP70 family sugar kinase
VNARAQEAGPDPRREVFPPLGMEAAGPAGPRLIIEEVGFRVGTERVEARATLSLGTRSFTGSAAGPAGADHVWKLAAAASVAALQHYLQQCAVDPPTPQVQLLDIAAITTGIGQEIVNATVRLQHGSSETDLLGSALVRNDRCSTAVAAALDAVSRRLSRLGFPIPLPEAARVDVHAPAPPDPPLPSDRAAGGNGGTRPTHVEPGRTPPVAPEPLPLAEPARATSAPPAAVAADRVRDPGLVATGVTSPALGVAISPTSIRAAAVSPSGEILAEARRPSPSGTDPEATLARAREAARDAIAGLNSSASTLAAIGLAVPGRLSLDDGTCISCGDFPSWRDVPIAAPFAEEFGLPIALVGPTQAAALAEMRFGAARDLSNIVFVRVGIDIDLAVILDGRPLSLSQSGPGQAGHIVIEADGPRCVCGQTGCWQALANREALVARAVKALRSGDPSSLGAAVDNRYGAITPSLVARMASGGDAVARRAVDETGRFLAIGLANLVALFDPEAVIVDSAPAPVGLALLQAAEATLKSSPRAQALAHCVLLSPELGDSAPVLGAAAWAGQNAA